MKAYLEPQEVARIEKAAPNRRDKLLIRTLFHLGCRVTEALCLTMEDIDFNRALLTIKHLKKRLKLSCPYCGARLGTTHLFCPKCGGKIEKSLTEEQENRRQRVLPIDSDTLKMLKKYVRCGGPELKDLTSNVHFRGEVRGRMAGKVGEFIRLARQYGWDEQYLQDYFRSHKASYKERLKSLKKIRRLWESHKYGKAIFENKRTMLRRPVDPEEMRNLWASSNKGRKTRI